MVRVAGAQQVWTPPTCIRKGAGERLAHAWIYFTALIPPSTDRLENLPYLTRWVRKRLHRGATAHQRMNGEQRAIAVAAGIILYAGASP